MNKKALWITTVAVALVACMIFGACTVGGIKVKTMCDAASFRDGNTAEYNVEMSVVLVDGDKSQEVCAYRDGQWSDPYGFGFAKPDFVSDGGTALDFQESQLSDVQFSANEEHGITSMTAKITDTQSLLGVANASDATVEIVIGTTDKSLRSMEIAYTVRGTYTLRVLIRSELAA